MEPVVLESHQLAIVERRRAGEAECDAVRNSLYERFKRDEYAPPPL
jgi:hypothetical protein